MMRLTPRRESDGCGGQSFNSVVGREFIDAGDSVTFISWSAQRPQQAVHFHSMSRSRASVVKPFGATVDRVTRGHGPTNQHPPAPLRSFTYQTLDMPQPDPLT
jgi:hypothetical protein